MATTLAPSRQPFGVLDDSRVRNLQSIKNRQNAITTTCTSVKRRAPSPDLSDSENLDPSVFDSCIKRKRGATDDDVSVAKPSRIFTQITPQSTKSYAPRPTLTPSSIVRADLLSKSSLSAPLSAPAAAGRSPPRAINKPASRRKFAPPMIRGLTSPSISVAAALKGTLAHKKSRPSIGRAVSLDTAKPQSWFFDIFEEAEEHQEYKMCEWTMTQSSAALDISDSEGRQSSSCDQEDGVVESRGKENIDPNDMFVSTTPDAAQTATGTTETAGGVAATSEARPPLSDLNAADFYAEGLNATSVVLVQSEDTADPEVSPEHKDAQSTPHKDFTFESPITKEPALKPEATEAVPLWAQVSSLTSSKADTTPTEEETADIEIWESFSAKDENENSEEYQNSSTNIVVEAGEIACVSAFVLQEL